MIFWNKFFHVQQITPKEHKARYSFWCPFVWFYCKFKFWDFIPNVFIEAENRYTDLQAFTRILFQENLRSRNQVLDVLKIHYFIFYFIFYWCTLACDFSQCNLLLIVSNIHEAVQQFRFFFASVANLNNPCMKSVQIRSFFWSVFSCIRTEYRPEKTPYLDTFHVVNETN